MYRLMRRCVTTTITSLAVVGLLASQARAHECFNTQRSAAAETQIAAHSHGWFDIQTWQLLAIFDGTPCDPSSGPCTPTIPGTEALASVDPELLIGVILGFAPPAALGSPAAVDAFNVLVAFNQAVADAAAQNGVPTHYLTLANATAAGGATHSPQGVTTDGKGIDHFPDVYGSQLFAAFQTVFCADFSCP
jgi:hypothetical protein